ncbi:methyltransferase type 11 [Chromatium okenii]|uniref:tetratricopeptide repeat protein n=1 Tax=Chromatium okenii TaxID=61644 RepID=UPI00190363F2|nr:tetratricopeptide repeat protein [Chromatium okenii]MBK1640997.1 methyltransferase type 11 [Chromatium okenii]
MHNATTKSPFRPRKSSNQTAAPSLSEQEMLVALFNAEKFVDAEAFAHQLINRYPAAAFSWKALGTVLLALERQAEALPVIQRAVELAPHDSECLNSLGKALQSAHRIEEAMAYFTQALVLQPDYASAVANRGNALAQLGRYEEGLIELTRALTLKPHSAIIFNDRANVLKTLRRLNEALNDYVQALALKPNFAQAHNNLGLILQDLGRPEDALPHHHRAIELKPDFVKAKFNYVQCAQQLHFASDAANVRQMLLRALKEGWSYPGKLTKICSDFIKLNPIIQHAIQRSATLQSTRVSLSELLSAAELDALITDELLMTVLVTMSVCDLELERLLTLLRHAMLNDVAYNSALYVDSSPRVQLLQALALQCYLNEYVFSVTEEENRRITALESAMTVALMQQLPIFAPHLIALAAYCSLERLPKAENLLSQNWSQLVTEILIQHLREPQEQNAYCQAMPRLTEINTGISALVKNQYEENPYPRWVKTNQILSPLTIDAFVRQQFPQVPFTPLNKHHGTEILIAGCGTGQHSINTAQRFPDAQVLAIDLSLHSLGYAQRKTAELGIKNLRYAQADILQFNALDMQFDLIESAGVLHHLEAPLVGWEILLSHLRPGGFLSLGLYSQHARTAIVKAREFIAQRGYHATPEDIRRCRQELMTQRDQTDYRQLATSSDFFTLSGCRDLIFHVNEHYFTLQQLAEIIDRFQLKFLGFVVDQNVSNAYLNCFPDDPTATNLNHWTEFEARYPETFAGMYQFWMQKQS